MNPCVIVDTNVLLVAGKRHREVTPACVATCATRLAEIMQSGRIALDDRFEIIGEYLRKHDPPHQKTPGDLFAMWVLQNRANPGRCNLVHLERNSDGEYTVFPQHPALASFDPSDKKFVAVSAAHADHLPILEAADSKWLDWEPALAEYGIGVDFLCPPDLERFHRKKFGP